MAFGDRGKAVCRVVTDQNPTEEGIEWAACISRLKGLCQWKILRRSAAAHPDTIATAGADGIPVLIARAAQIGRESGLFSAPVKQNHERIGCATAIGGF